MRLIKMLLLSIALLGVSQYSIAICNRASGDNTVDIDVDFGNIIVSPNLNIGDTIGKKHIYSFKPNSYFFKGCANDKEMVSLRGFYTPAGRVDNGQKSYPTNVPGVGIRISLINGSTLTYFGIDNAVRNVNARFITAGGYGVSLYGYKIVVELVKTKSEVGTGDLSSLKDLSGYLRQVGGLNSDKPIARINIGGTASTVIVNPSCSLDSDNGRDMTVVLNPVRLMEFNGMGSTAGDTKFDFKLKCGGGADSYKIDVKTLFTSGAVSPADKVKGVLANSADTSSIAQGIGVQVLMRDKPIELDNKLMIEKIGGGEPVIRIPMTARYYQYEKSSSAGHVEAYMTYNIFYE